MLAYNRDVKRALYFNIAVIALLITALAGLSALYPKNDGIEVVAETTTMRVTVTDLNDKPIKGAKVKTLEDNKTYVTDSLGRTAVMEVPFQQTSLNKALEGNFSTVTLLVFCDGYADFILFNCIVYADRMRDGPTVRLFAASPDLPYVSLVEVPPDDWLKQLLDKYDD